MNETLKKNEIGNYQILSICIYIGIILSYDFYENYFWISNLLFRGATWNFDSIVALSVYPFGLLLIILLYKRFKTAWWYLVFTCFLAVLNALLNYMIELSLPTQENDPNAIESLIGLIDVQRLGFMHYFTIIGIYGSLLLFCLKESVQEMYYITKPIRLSALFAAMLAVWIKWMMMHYFT